MELPKTEVELRIVATEVMEEFIQDVVNKLGFVPREDVEAFNLRAVKAGVIWAARAAIRRYCPHLEGEGERDLSGMFDKANDQPI